MLKDQDLAQPGVIGDYGRRRTVSGENGGMLGITAPGHTNSNSFQLDQLWFGIGKPATMESNAGFRADIVFGALADANREGTFFTTDPDDGLGADDHGTGDLPHLFQAYVEYLAPGRRERHLHQGRPLRDPDRRRVVPAGRELQHHARHHLGAPAREPHRPPGERQVQPAAAWTGRSAW